MKTGANQQKSNSADKADKNRLNAGKQQAAKNEVSGSLGFNPANNEPVNPRQVLALQTKVGNQAVNRLIQRQRDHSAQTEGLSDHRQQFHSKKGRLDLQVLSQAKVEPTTQVSKSGASAMVQRQDQELFEHEKDLLDDLESGTANVKQNLEYIKQGMDLINEHGPDKLKNSGLAEGMELAASRMLKPTRHLQKKINKIQKFVDDIQGFQKWLTTGRELAAAVQGNISNLDELQAIIAALEDHAEASETYIDMLSGWLAKGGQAASKAGAVLEIAKAYFTVAKSAVKNGSKLQYKLSHKSEHWLEKNLPGEYPSGEGPDIPHPPMEWSSSKELRDDREAREERHRRWENEQRMAARRRKLVGEFDKNVFPKIWKRKRRRFYRIIVRQMRQQKSGPVNEWYEHMGKVDKDEAPRDYDGGGWESSVHADLKAGRPILPIDRHPDPEQIHSEITVFRDGIYVPRWPDFDKLYADELAKHLKEADDKEWREIGIAVRKGVLGSLGLSD